MIPAKTLDHAVSNSKYRLGKYYVRIGLIFPQDPYVINEWPLNELGLEDAQQLRNFIQMSAVQFEQVLALVKHRINSTLQFLHFLHYIGYPMKN